MAAQSVIGLLTSFIPGFREVAGDDCLELAQAVASGQGGLTALAGGAQAISANNGNLCQFSINEFKTVGTAADSAILPLAIQGLSVTVINDAASNALAIFANPANNPATGALDTITPVGSGTANTNATAVSLTVAAGAMIFECFAAGKWKQVK